MSRGGKTIDLGPLPELIGYVLRRAQLAVFQDFFNAFAPLTWPVRLIVPPTLWSVWLWFRLRRMANENRRRRVCCGFTGCRLMSDLSIRGGGRMIVTPRSRSSASIFSQ